MSKNIEKLKKLVLRMLLDGGGEGDTSLRFAQALVRKDKDLAHELCSGVINTEREVSELSDSLRSKIVEAEAEKQKFFTESDKVSVLLSEISTLLIDFDGKYLSKLNKSFSSYSSSDFSQFLKTPMVIRIIIDAKYNWFEKLMIIIFNKNPETLPVHISDQASLLKDLERQTIVAGEELTRLLDKKSTLENLANLQYILVQTVEPKSVKVKEVTLLSEITKKEDQFKADVASELDMFDKIVEKKKAEILAIREEADKEAKKLEEIRTRIAKANLKLKSVEDKISPYDRMVLNADALEKILENVRETGKVNNESGTKVDEKLGVLLSMGLQTLFNIPSRKEAGIAYVNDSELQVQVKDFKKVIQNI